MTFLNVMEVVIAIEIAILIKQGMQFNSNERVIIALLQQIVGILTPKPIPGPQVAIEMKFGERK